jgi:hypothetical protein
MTRHVFLVHQVTSSSPVSALRLSVGTFLSAAVVCINNLDCYGDQRLGLQALKVHYFSAAAHPGSALLASAVTPHANDVGATVASIQVCAAFLNRCCEAAALVVAAWGLLTVLSSPSKPHT